MEVPLCECGWLSSITMPGIAAVAVGGLSEAEAVPLSVENESLARRSYEAGQIGLTDLLALRRETVDTRLRYLDALLDAALARFNLRVAAGELP